MVAVRAKSAIITRGPARRSGVLPGDPGRHRALLLHHRGLERVDQIAAEAPRRLGQHVLVDEKAIAAIGQPEPALAEWFDQAADANGGGEPCEQQPAGREDVPDAAE